MGHVCAAMTHLAEPIRADALKLLEIIMDWRADLVAAQYLTQVLQHFSDALSRPTRGRSLKAGSLGALLSIITGLHSFLAKAVPHLSSSVGSLGLSRGAGTRNEANYYSSNINDTSNLGNNGGGGGGGGRNISSQGGKGDQPEFDVLAWRRCLWPSASTETSAGKLDTQEAISARIVLDFLVEAWGECSPSEFSTAPDLGPARAATSILQCCNLILGAWGPNLAGPLRGSAKNSATVAILEKIAVYFPVNEPAVVIAPPLREQLVQLNVSAAQLLVFFLPDVMEYAAQHAQQEPAWVPRLLDWLQDVMATGTALPLEQGNIGGRTMGNEDPHLDNNSNAEIKHGKKKKEGGKKKGGNQQQSGGSTAAAAAAVPAAVYGAALTAVRGILPLLPTYRRRDMMAAAWALWRRSPVKSGPRAKALSFFSTFLANPAESFYAPLPPLGDPLVLQEGEASEWVRAMPRFLWELGAGAPATTAAGLQLILDAARFKMPNAPGVPEISFHIELMSIQPQLAPLFGVLMPQKLSKPSKNSADGGSGSKDHQGQFVAGPLAALPESIQWLAVDVFYHLPGLTEATLNTAAVIALGGGHYHLSTALRLIDIISLKASEALPAQFWGTLLTMVSGKSRSGVEKESEGTSGAWERHAAVVEAACRAAVAAAGAKEALAALAPPLIESWRSGTAGGASISNNISTAKILYGLLSICSMASACEQRRGSHIAGDSDCDVDSDGGRGIIARSADGSIAKALPEALLAFVKSCIGCSDEDPAVHAASSRSAAKLAAKLVIQEPITLLSSTLVAISETAENPKEPRVGIESGLFIILELARADCLEAELIKASELAERAVKGLKTAIDGRFPGLSSDMHRLIAMLSQKLGKDIC